MSQRRPMRRGRRGRLPALEPIEPRVLLAAPELDAGVLIKNGTANLTVAWESTPDVADWDGDGKKDLLVGQFTSGYIWFFANKGTDAAPTFNGGSYVTAAGQPITTSYG